MVLGIKYGIRNMNLEINACINSLMKLYNEVVLQLQPIQERIRHKDTRSICQLVQKMKLVKVFFTRHYLTKTSARIMCQINEFVELNDVIYFLIIWCQISSELLSTICTILS